VGGRADAAWVVKALIADAPDGPQAAPHIGFRPLRGVLTNIRSYTSGVVLLFAGQDGAAAGHGFSALQSAAEEGRGAEERPPQTTHLAAEDGCYGTPPTEAHV
jgi:hypothetical protein